MSGDPSIFKDNAAKAFSLGSEPPLDFDVPGLCALGQYRLRPTWFGCVLEECWQHEDGSRSWKRCTEAVPIPFQGRRRFFLSPGTEFKITPKADGTT